MRAEPGRAGSSRRRLERAVLSAVTSAAHSTGAMSRSVAVKNKHVPADKVRDVIPTAVPGDAKPKCPGTAAPVNEVIGRFTGRDRNR